MTDNEFRNPLPPPVPPVSPVRHLYRAVDKKRWLGVAKGLSDYFGVPVAVLRAAFVLLSFAGGLGLFAYLAAAALVPKVGEANSLGDRVSGGRPDRLLAVIAGVALAAYGLFNGGSFDFVAVAALGGAGYYLWTKDRPGVAHTGGPTWPQPSAHGHVASTPPAQNAPDWQTWQPDVNLHDDYGLVPPPPYVPPTVPVPAKAITRKRWGWPSLAACIVAMVVVAPFQNVFGVLVVGFFVLLAAFVVGLIARRASWSLLVPLFGLFLLMLPAASFVTAGVPVNAQVGEVILSASDVNNGPVEREMSAGHFKVDLRNVTVVQPLKYRVGAGQIELLVPSNVGYRLQSEVGVGDVKIGDQDTGGTKVKVDRTVKPDGAIRMLDLDLKVGIGNITIVPTDPELGRS